MPTAYLGSTRLTMTLSGRLAKLHSRYRKIAFESRNAEQNTRASALPLGWDERGRLFFPPACSIAVQALVPKRLFLHRALVAQQKRITTTLPLLSEAVFWQPPGTFHLNVGVIQRLSKEILEREECQKLLDTTLQWSDTIIGTPSYRLNFRGIQVATDGTIIACGYPEAETPWQLRESLIAYGFRDQQKLFHITLGRILRQLRPSTWRKLIELLDDMTDLPLGDWIVQEALLVMEKEGFLHNRSAYEVIRKIRLNSQ